MILRHEQFRQIYLQHGQIHFQHGWRGNPNAHRQDIRTSQVVGTKAFGSRESNQITGCQTNGLSNRSKRLLGGYRF